MPAPKLTVVNAAAALMWSRSLRLTRCKRHHTNRYQPHIKFRGVSQSHGNAFARQNESDRMSQYSLALCP
jgi:hypothetical protein